MLPLAKHLQQDWRGGRRRGREGRWGWGETMQLCGTSGLAMIFNQVQGGEPPQVSPPYTINNSLSQASHLGCGFIERSLIDLETKSACLRGHAPSQQSQLFLVLSKMGGGSAGPGPKTVLNGRKLWGHGVLNTLGATGCKAVLITRGNRCGKDFRLLHVLIQKLTWIEY